MSTDTPTPGESTGPEHTDGQPLPGQPMPGPMPGPVPPKRLYRTRDDQMIGGVCGGIARYFDVDPTLVRVLAVVALVLGFPAAFVGYLVAWAIMPSN
ncbi:MAG TPA: PspC domain-containing protein [Marmoricola sp.]|nr:PspC domain-containing protein [Marmoricola sp.]